MIETRRGRIVVISGPSGAGKTTVLKRVLAGAPLPLTPSVSATTRLPRPGEVEGVDYHFLSPAEFEQKRQAGEFLECFQVFGGGHWYGTLASEVDRGLAAGRWVVLEIDVQGALSVAQRVPDAITIFIAPSSRDELERRLRNRKTESEEAIRHRLARADFELAHAAGYRYRVVNDDLDRAVREVIDLLTREAEGEAHDRRAS